MARAERHRSRRVGVPAAVAVVVALAAGVIAGYALRYAMEPERGLLVNGGDVQQVVYEAVPDPGRAPPRCLPRSADGIGRWECVVEATDGVSPTVYRVDVSESGAVRGSAADGTDRFTSCCLDMVESG